MLLLCFQFYESFGNFHKIVILYNVLNNNNIIFFNIHLTGDFYEIFLVKKYH